MADTSDPQNPFTKPREIAPGPRYNSLDSALEALASAPPQSSIAIGETVASPPSSSPVTTIQPSIEQVRESLRTAPHTPTFTIEELSGSPETGVQTGNTQIRPDLLALAIRKV